MSQEAEADRRRERRRRLVPIWVPLLMGLLSLSNMLSRPRIAMLHRSMWCR